MHVQSKCELPVHPSTIQIVDMIEGYRVAEADAKNSPAIRKLHTSSLAQMQIPLDMLLNPRPKWAYLEDMRRDVKDLQIQFAMSRQAFVRQLTLYDVPAKDMIYVGMWHLYNIGLSNFTLTKIWWRRRLTLCSNFFYRCLIPRYA